MTDYAADILTPQLLKAAVTTALNKLLEPIQTAFNASKEWQDITESAYPPLPPPPKKVKKEKNLGTFNPRLKGEGSGKKDSEATKGDDKASKDIQAKVKDGEEKAGVDTKEIPIMPKTE